MSQAEDRDRGMEQESHSVQVRGISLFIGRVGWGGGGAANLQFVNLNFFYPPPSKMLKNFLSHPKTNRHIQNKTTYNGTISTNIKSCINSK